MKYNRREFLILSTGLAATMTASAETKPKTHIIVAGAGLSGLSAAYELALRGFKVTVVEGRDRVGGRIFTLSEPFVDGQFVELGGELVGDGYKRLLGYTQKFKLSYEPFEQEFETGGSVTNLQGGIGTSAILKNSLYPIGATLEPHPYGLTGDESKMLPPALLTRHLRAMVRDMSGDDLKLAALDRISLAAALRSRGASEEAIKLMNISLNYNSIETASAGGAVYDAAKRSVAGTGANRIVGGNSEVPKALVSAAKKLGVKFVMNAAIKKVSHTQNSVSVSFADKNGRLKSVAGQKLVCTIPFSVLRGITFSPALPEQKSRAIQGLAYTRVTKVMMQGSRFEWDRRNVGSSVWTDTPLERIFSMSGKRGDERGIFTSWTEGDGAALVEKMGDAERQTWAKAELEKAIPFMKGAIERTATKSWTNDSFARGGYSHFQLGQLTALKPHIKTAVGAIHFAGEHTAEKWPGMEGALESAERVVSEISG